MRLSDFSALTFDCYGTLIDWERGMLDALIPWRERCSVNVDEAALLTLYARYETVIQTESPFLSYRDVVAEVLVRMSKDLGAPARREELDKFGYSVGTWPPFSDSREALAYLQEHFLLTAITNVDNASFKRTHELLGNPFRLIVTADDVGSYKPAFENFRYAFMRLAERGVACNKILHVAQSLYHDIAPAQALGLANVWINRQTGRGAGMTPPSDAQPDLCVKTIAELVAVHRAEN